MTAPRDGNAIVYCEGAFGTTNGKTAHGLVRRSERYRLLSVVDSRCAGRDAGDLLDNRPTGVPVLADLEAAMADSGSRGITPSHWIMGLAPDGGRLTPAARDAVAQAIRAGLNVDCGLHDFLSEDSELTALAETHGVQLRDIRKPPARQQLHGFSGKIEEVTALKVAVLGTDSAVGKRTTAWLIIDELRRRGTTAELVGTGQTAWLQGARHGIVLDSLINDFVAGEIEHAVWTAWREFDPAVIVIEGQGSLMNPAYPGGYEILAAGRPDVVVLQHAPAREEYDGFPGYPLHPLNVQIQAIELISGRPVVCIAVNHEGLSPAQVAMACVTIEQSVGRPACDMLLDGAGVFVDLLQRRIAEGRATGATSKDAGS